MSWSAVRASPSPSASVPRPSQSPVSSQPSNSSQKTSSTTTPTASAAGGGWASASSGNASARPTPSPKSGGWAQAQISRPQPQAQAQVSQPDLRNPDATTARMLQRLELTEDLADMTLSELDDQNKKITQAQDDLAEVHDDLDTSDRKLAGIKSFWGVAWGKKKHDQRNMKARGEFEKDMAKSAMKEERIRQHDEKKNDSAAQTTHMAQMNKALHDPSLHTDLKRQEKADRKGGPPASRREESSNEPMRFEADGFFFEERDDGTGDQIQAEQDLERIHDHVGNLKTKAWTMGQKVDESSKRLEDVQTEVDRADARTTKNIQRGNKIIG